MEPFYICNPKSISTIKDYEISIWNRKLASKNKDGGVHNPIIITLPTYQPINSCNPHVGLKVNNARVHGAANLGGDPDHEAARRRGQEEEDENEEAQ